jgi:Flp pilus assembly protein TadG
MAATLASAAPVLPVPDPNPAPSHMRRRLSHVRAHERGTRPPVATTVGQRGSVSAELVIVTPVLLLLVMFVVQFALWQHAQHIAEAAAQRGAQTARVAGGSNTQGQQAAQTAVAQLGGSLLTDPSVTVSRSRGVVTVEVAGTAESVVPFLSLPVHAVVQGPVERFVPPGSAPP